ncbi:hypothetical protein B0T11DRAFT_287133 [Plectosphaerella cucumerina]|uniref:Uncharacterized protein n=1 Tax=Plectosphaerella cucumerina TaxID=40658 RepID=A0A8K0X0W0_9PEZI|nr:hypothetical protein B0T11DRAFT_287133 [Plectosphaerella cucumerina]
MECSSFRSSRSPSFWPFASVSPTGFISCITQHLNKQGIDPQFLPAARDECVLSRLLAPTGPLQSVCATTLHDLLSRVVLAALISASQPPHTTRLPLFGPRLGHADVQTPLSHQPHRGSIVSSAAIANYRRQRQPLWIGSREVWAVSHDIAAILAWHG